MPTASFREARNVLTAAVLDELISENEHVILHDLKFEKS